MRGQSEPFDVNIDDGIKARLYPSGNRCEKRAFAGVQIWDAPERQALRNTVKNSDKSRPFVFVDVGANVGLYSLYAQAYARAAGRETRILAIEPGHEVAQRLIVNAAFNGASIEHVPVAISDIAGRAYLSMPSTNRGEAQLSERGLEVDVQTLEQVCRVAKLSYIDAMKVDIEGHDEKALQAFFKAAPAALHPRLLIVETGRQEEASPLIALCQSNDYMVTARCGLNTLFEKVSHV